MSWPRESIERWSSVKLIPICMSCGKEYSPIYKNGYRTSNKCKECMKCGATKDLEGDGV